MPLARRTLAFYALPVAGITAMHWLVLLYLLKFSTDVVGLPASVVGVLFALARVWDAVSDPLVGWLSDRTRSRMGRRRPWMFAAALPLGLAYFALWSPPTEVPSALVVVWLGGSLWLFYAMQTCFVIPHASLGAELSLDYDERTRISGARQVADVFGMVAAVLCLHLLESGGAPRDVVALAGAGIGLVTALSILFGALRVDEPRAHQGRAAENPLRAMADIARNPHAVRITLALLLCEVGLGSLLVAIPYVGLVTGDEGGSAQTMIGFIVPFALAIPLWVWLAKRIGKARAWMLGCLFCGSSFGAMWLAAEWALGLIPLITVVIGLSQAGMRTLAPSVKADVIDWDEVRTGERKEGTYFAAWNLVDKLGGALSVVVVGFLIEGSNGGIDPEGVKFVTSLWPAGLTLLAAGVLVGFKLDAGAHAALRAAIDRRPDATIIPLPKSSTGRRERGVDRMIA